MRNVWTGVLGLLLLLGAAGWAWAEEPPMLPPPLSPEEALGEGSFWWDVRDGDIVTYSDGTGGMRTEVPLPEERSIRYLSMYSPEHYVGPEAGAWVEGWFEALDARHISIHASECHVVDGQLATLLVQGGPWEEDNRVYSFVWDLRTGEQVRLNDLFYDGIDYIEYINDAAVAALMGQRDLDDYMYALTFEDLRRPFSGFPKDYPYFSIMEGPHGGWLLVLCVAEQNPLFNQVRNSGKLAVPLTDDLSPYGLPWVEVTMSLEERPMPPGTGFLTAPIPENTENADTHRGIYIARVGLGEGADAEVEAGINEALAALAERAAVHPLRYLQDAYAPMYPHVFYDEEGTRLRAEYYAMVYGEDGINDVALLGAAEVSLQTGAVLDGSGLAREAEVAYLLQCGGWEHAYTESEPPEGFALSEEAMYLGAWTGVDRDTGEERLCAAWLDPSGIEAYYEAIDDEMGE